MSILIKDAVIENKLTNIYIEDNIISEIGGRIEADQIIEADGMAAFPGLVNTHTHTAMTLLRGYGDDMPLFDWLQKKIWPVETKFTKEDNYWGSKLAILEMIKSGTTTFNDMYFNMEETAKAVDEMGVRAVLAYGFVDLFDKERREKEITGSKDMVRSLTNMNNSRIKPSLGPHAVYTISEDGLQWIKQYSDEIQEYIKSNLNSWINDLPPVAKQVEMERAEGIEDESWWDNYSGSSSRSTPRTYTAPFLNEGSTWDTKEKKYTAPFLQ